MKMPIKPFNIFTLITLALVPLLVQAANGDNIEKKRTITKSYNVTNADKLSIENSFGNVSITTWDKNEIEVLVEIGVHAATEDKAQHMLDEINVTNNQGGHDINFKTSINGMGNGKKNKGYDGKERQFYVDYRVNMPSGNPLRIENSFGKILMPDFAGNASLTSKFGELTTGNLTDAKLVHVEFGNVATGKLTNAELVFKFNGKSTVGGLSGNSKVHVEFCGEVNLTIENALTDLALSESYSSIRLKVPDDLSARFDIHTNFGSFKNSTNFKISEEKDDESSGPKFDKNYSGSAGSGAAKIKMKSSFGSIRMASVNDKTIGKKDADEDKDVDKDQDKDDDKDDDKEKVNM